MERAVFVPEIDRLAPGGRWDRLYLGSEHCVRRLPGERDLDEALGVAAGRAMAFTLVTPFLDEAELLDTLALVRALPEHPAVEVVANDLGLIEALRSSGWGGTLVAGRLLTRQRRGPGFEAWGDLPLEAAAALRASALDSPAFVEALGACGVRRFELDDLVQGVVVPALPEGVRVSLYRPWLLVTATRNCPWVFDGRVWARGRGCAAPCAGRTLRLTVEADGERRVEAPSFPLCQTGLPESGTLSLAGCAQFLEHRSEAAPPPGVDRIVWQPEVPA